MMAFKQRLVPAKWLEINEQNYIAAFSLLMIQLNLQPVAKKKQLFNSFTRSYPYSFKVSEAIAAMENLHLKIDSEILDNSISFSFDHTMALSLLRMYFCGHLLHDPISRTETSLSLGGIAQISPKGTAILYEFCKNIGMKRRHMPEVVKSDLNSMKLFQFDRSSSTKRVLYSEYLNHLLISELMGPKPNVWSPNAKPAPVINLFESDDLDFEIASDQILFCRSMEAKQDQHSNDGPRVSLFHHRYFTNPESDAHIQYYESSTGMRIFEDMNFQDTNGEVCVKYCFSGKAFVQWLCDCTTLYSSDEAIEFGQLMLNYSLLLPVMALSSNPHKIFHNRRDAFYVWSEDKQHLCRWKSNPATVSNDANNNSPNASVDLDVKRNIFNRALSDPGIRHLFKIHLEKEKCSENMNAYLQLKEFHNTKRKLTQLMKYYNSTLDTNKKKRLSEAADNIAKKCIAMASYLCTRYFSVDSSCDLNIDYALQEEIDEVVKLIRGGLSQENQVSENDFSVYLKTPVIKEDFFLDVESQTTSEESNAVDGSDSVEGLSKTAELDVAGPTDTLAETIKIVNRINLVFSKISNTVYRMMEMDSYPKFIQSEEYMRAVETLLHRS